MWLHTRALVLLFDVVERGLIVQAAEGSASDRVQAPHQSPYQVVVDLLDRYESADHQGLFLKEIVDQHGGLSRSTVF